MYKVQMLACGKSGEVREVDLPKGFFDQQLMKGRDLGFILHNIFRFGQNEIQPKQHPPVSCGDVIEWDDGLYMVCATGFRDLSQAEYDQYIALDQHNRPFAALKMVANIQ